MDRRYRRYCEQMRGLAGGFEAVAGERAATGYTALAGQTISRHFRSLRDGIVAQLQAVRKALGEKDVSAPGMTRGDTPRLKGTFRPGSYYRPGLKGLVLVPTSVAACRNPLVPVRITNRD